jgi:hypothetical protein
VRARGARSPVLLAACVHLLAGCGDSGLSTSGGPAETGDAEVSLGHCVGICLGHRRRGHTRVSATSHRGMTTLPRDRFLRGTTTRDRVQGFLPALRFVLVLRSVKVVGSGPDAS